MILICRSSRGDAAIDGIQIRCLPDVSSRAVRFFVLSVKALMFALKTRADIYQFHDPELLVIGLVLRCLGKKVIYDVHEDVPQDVRRKDWIPRLIRLWLWWPVEHFESWAARRMTFLVTATPFIRERFLREKCRAIDVQNYPVTSELDSTKINWLDRDRAVCYVGTISRDRGVFEMIQAVERTGGRLLLAGTFHNRADYERAADLSGWARVDYLGVLGRQGVNDMMSRARAGLVVIHPHSGLENALLTKMFEYMSAGIPVIASDFPLWKETIENGELGICVDWRDPDALARAIQWILDHPENAMQMGRNGRKAVLERFDWKGESRKLLALYDQLMKETK